MLRNFVRLIVGLSMSLSMLLGTIASGGRAQEATPSDDCGRYTDAEVAAAVAPHQVDSVYDVPKCLKKDYTFAFLNIDSSIPAFAELNDGMQKAADFYGVTLLLTDLRNKPEDSVPQYETLSARNPDVVGTLVNASEAGLRARVEADGKVLVVLGGSFSQPPDTRYVVNTLDDTAAGQIAGKAIADAAAPKLENEWKGRTVVYVGLGQADCEPCVKRMEGGLAAIRETIEIDDNNVVLVDTQGRTDQAQTAMTDVLTSHPDAVFLIVPLNDEAGVGGVQALRAANRSGDGLTVLLGADEFGRDALRSDTTGIIIGAVDFNSWATGWMWIEAAIAVAQGEDFSRNPPENYPMVTKENVDQLFPADKK